MICRIGMVSAILIAAAGTAGSGVAAGAQARLPGRAPDSSPSSGRVIYRATFDTGSKNPDWPGEFELAEMPPAPATGRAARAGARGGGPEKGIGLAIEPARPVGARTKLRFRYYLAGASAMTVQVFDLTVMDNRHVVLSNLTRDAWTTTEVDITRDSRRNDGSAGPLEAGHRVDLVSFLVQPSGSQPLDLYVDDVVLYDTGE